MNIFKIGIRSIGRNRRRTLVTTLATGFAGFIMIFYASLMEGLTATLERNALAMELGEIQIHADGYRRDPDLYKRIDQPDVLIAELEARGYRSAPRLFGFGLAAAGVSSAGVQIRGIDVEREARITNLHTHVMLGEWLDHADPKGVVIGKKLMRTLNVKPGAEIVILSQAADGSMANDLYRVRGVLKSVGEVLDRGGVLMVESSFRSLMAVPDGTHEIVSVRTVRTVDVEVAAAEIRTLADPHETLSWRGLQPALARMIDNSLANSIFMLIVTYAAIAMVILNATLMSVFERIREFGVMKAIGVTPAQVVGVILVEVMTQATIAVGVALAAGIPVSLYFEKNGIDLTALGGSDMSFVGVALDPIWYAEVNVTSVLLPVISLFLMVGLAALYPGIKAAVIPPLEAVRHR